MILIENKSSLCESVKYRKLTKKDVYGNDLKLKTEFLSGSPALTADINDKWSITVAPFTLFGDESIGIWMDTESGDPSYVDSFDLDDEDEAVAKFMSMVKFIDPDNFNHREVARKFDLEKC